MRPEIFTGSTQTVTRNKGFVPLRKPGKLPYDVHSISYDLEYGSAGLEVHVDVLTADDHVLVIDDVLATGGTAAASCHLIEKMGAEIAACAFDVELDTLARILHENADNGVCFIKSVSESVCSIGPMKIKQWA